MYESPSVRALCVGIDSGLSTHSHGFRRGPSRRNWCPLDAVEPAAPGPPLLAPNLKKVTPRHYTHRRLRFWPKPRIFTPRPFVATGDSAEHQFPDSGETEPGKIISSTKENCKLHNNYCSFGLPTRLHPQCYLPMSRRLFAVSWTRTDLRSSGDGVSRTNPFRASEPQS